MKTQILTDEQFNRPANQNRDNEIIGYRSVETETKPLNIARVSDSVCDCGKPIDSRYAPCCSLKCWEKKFL